MQADSSAALAQDRQQLQRSLSEVEKGQGLPQKARELQADIQRIQGELRQQRARLQQSDNAQKADQAQESADAQAKNQAEAAKNADKNNPSNSSDRALDILA